jgi:hypothetical protein
MKKTERDLYLDLLKKIARAGHLNHLFVAVNTNAFWATSPSKAFETLNNMVGLTQLCVSASEYHQAYLPIERIINAITAGLKTNIIINLTFYTPRGERTLFVEQVENKVGLELLSQIKIKIRPVELGGRANNLPEAYWRGIRSELPKGRCLLLNRPVILENLKVAACCNTTAVAVCDNSPLIVGDLKQKTLSEILTEARQNYILQAIRLFGPSFLVSLLSEEEQKKLSQSYVVDDICSLCTDIMTNHELISSLENSLQSPENSKLIDVSMIFESIL